MILFLILFIFLLRVSVVQNCYQFCRVNLCYGDKILDLNPESCSHIILNAYKYNEFYGDLLEEAYSELRDSDFDPKIKILVSLNETIDNQVLENMEKFDGFHFHWPDLEFNFKLRYFQQTSLSNKKEIINSSLVNIRKKFKNKIIVATVGAEYTLDGYFNFNLFNDNIDFLAIESRVFLIGLHTPNYYFSKSRDVSIHSAYSNDKLSLDNLAHTWINNGFPKDRILIYTNWISFHTEPRLKTIWSSVNSLAGLFYDNMQDLKKKDLYEMVDSIEKFKKLQICHSDKIKKSELTLSCYYSLKEDNEEFTEIEENFYRKCSRIILKSNKIFSNFNFVASKPHFLKAKKYFQSLNLTQTALILSIPFDDQFYNIGDEVYIASIIYKFLKEHCLQGIEFIFDETVKWEKVYGIIKELNAKKENIEIGLQFNVFKVKKPLISLMNDITWVTHKINPISDAALAIYYQWNKLHEEYGLNLKKVVIKISPSIWQQNASESFPIKPKNLQILEEEYPEEDLLLNRKYLCLNETIKGNLPSTTETEKFLNLPKIFTIHKNSTSNYKENLSKKNRTQMNKNEMFNSFLMIAFGKNIDSSNDLYYIRYDTKEIIQYKIKVAAKHGFGGIVIDSINDDDVHGICNISIFKAFEEIF